MLLFTILLLTLLLSVVAGVLLLGVGGAAFIVVFGDVIVCAVFIALIIRYLIKRRKD